MFSSASLLLGVLAIGCWQSRAAGSVDGDSDVDVDADSGTYDEKDSGPEPPIFDCPIPLVHCDAQPPACPAGQFPQAAPADCASGSCSGRCWSGSCAPCESDCLADEECVAVFRVGCCCGRGEGYSAWAMPSADRDRDDWCVGGLREEPWPPPEECGYYSGACGAPDACGECTRCGETARCEGGRCVLANPSCEPDCACG